MAFQTQVNIDLAIGVPGDRATANPFAYNTETPLAGPGGVTCGNFCWLQPDGTATKSAAGAVYTEPLGIVERIIDKYNYDVRSEGTLEIVEGQIVTAGMIGDYKVLSKTASTVGQAVFADETDGSISTAAVGGTVAGARETVWRVTRAAGANEMIIISSQRHVASSGGGGGGAAIDQTARDAAAAAQAAADGNADAITGLTTRVEALEGAGG